eukprot:TRINITY_DN37180_c0_g1_i1.p2 TRINITY_DN37180_c0_g1~~TRINITY_DN37180_c0_g1_i1.p2  ORF type:complete len:165 (+),score=40.74 TRINITY_DN37180_c0_g1_i1:42-536(+)
MNLEDVDPDSDDDTSVDSANSSLYGATECEAVLQRRVEEQQKQAEEQPLPTEEAENAKDIIPPDGEQQQQHDQQQDQDDQQHPPIVVAGEVEQKQHLSPMEKLKGKVKSEMKGVKKVKSRPLHAVQRQKFKKQPASEGGGTTNGTRRQTGRNRKPSGKLRCTNT